MIMLLPCLGTTTILYERGRTSLMSAIGSKLKTLRKGRGLTQLELAERMDLSRATISNYEVGRRSPHLSELRRFAEFYGVGLDYFGVAPADEIIDLLARAKDVFENDRISDERKNELFEELMRLKLNLKSK